MISNRHEYSVVGYDHRKHVFELLRQQVTDSDNHEIKFIDFMEDSQPQYLLLLISDRQTQKTMMQIKQIKKDEQVICESQQVYSVIETDTHRLTEQIKDNWKRGNFKKSRRKSMDNFELLPNINRKQQ